MPFPRMGDADAFHHRAHSLLKAGVDCYDQHASLFRGHALGVDRDLNVSYLRIFI